MFDSQTLYSMMISAANSPGNNSGSADAQPQRQAVENHHNRKSEAQRSQFIRSKMSHKKRIHQIECDDTEKPEDHGYGQLDQCFPYRSLDQQGFFPGSHIFLWWSGT